MSKVQRAQVAVLTWMVVWTALWFVLGAIFGVNGETGIKAGVIMGSIALGGAVIPILILILVNKTLDWIERGD